MDIERVPGHRVIVDGEHVAVQYASADGQRLRAEFTRDGERLAFQTLLVEGDQDLAIEDATVEQVPVAIRAALVRRGYELVLAPGDDGDDSDESAADDRRRLSEAGPEVSD